MGQRSQVLPGHSSRKPPLIWSHTSRMCGAELGILFLVPVRVPQAIPLPRPRSATTDTDPPPGVRPQEPKAARDLRGHSVKSHPLNCWGLRAPVRERARPARCAGALSRRAGDCTQGWGPGPTEFPTICRLLYANLCHCVEVGAERRGV